MRRFLALPPRLGQKERGSMLFAVGGLHRAPKVTKPKRESV